VYAKSGDVYRPALIGEAPTLWFGVGLANKAAAAKTMTTAAPTAIRAGIGRDIEKGLQADDPRWRAPRVLSKVASSTRSGRKPADSSSSHDAIRSSAERGPVMPVVRS
jgi:hypothetical protein